MELKCTLAFLLGDGQIGKALGSEPSNSVGSNPTPRIAGQQRILLFVGKFHTSFSNRFHFFYRVRVLAEEYFWSFSSAE